MVTNVNVCICQWRATNNQPSICVNWQVDGKQNYKFFALRFCAEDFKKKLLRQQQQCTTSER